MIKGIPLYQYKMHLFNTLCLLIGLEAKRRNCTLCGIELSGFPLESTNTNLQGKFLQLKNINTKYTTNR